MKPLEGNSKEQKGLWTFLRKVWQCIWNSGSSISDCPNKAKSAQDIRNEYAEKCPWKGDLF